MKKATEAFISALIITICLYSCKNHPGANGADGSKLKDTGTVVVKNGKGENDTINYTCTGCMVNIKDTNSFNPIVKELTNDTRNALNFPLTFVPKSIDLTVVKQDSSYNYQTNKKIEGLSLLTGSYSYVAKNAYGTEIEGKRNLTKFLISGVIVDEEDQIKLDSLKFDGSDLINRELLAVRSDGEFISFLPLKNKTFDVRSSLSCVDKGTSFTITLDNDEEISLQSWNDFNCKGTSYYDAFSPAQFKKLSEHKIKTISVYYEKTIVCMVPDNCKDYFMQLTKLYGIK